MSKRPLIEPMTQEQRRQRAMTLARENPVSCVVVVGKYNKTRLTFQGMRFSDAQKVSRDAVTPIHPQDAEWALGRTHC